MNEPNSRGRMRWLAVAVLLVTFVAGGLVGVAFERTLLADETSSTRAVRWRGDGWGEARGPGGRIFASGGPMAEQLGLTAEQQARIDSILAQDRAKAGAILGEMRPRLQARYDSTRAAIGEVLTPEQRAAFERYREERRRMIERRLEGREQRGPGPQR